MPSRGCNLDNRTQKLPQPLPLLGGNEHDGSIVEVLHAAPDGLGVVLSGRRALPDRIPLVDHDHHRPAALVGVPADVGIERGHPLDGINHEQGDVRTLQVLSRLNHAQLFRQQVGFPFATDAGRVHQAKVVAVALELGVYSIAGGARRRRHD